jgi:hypothetical protein
MTTSRSPAIRQDQDDDDRDSSDNVTMAARSSVRPIEQLNGPNVSHARSAPGTWRPADRKDRPERQERKPFGSGTRISKRPMIPDAPQPVIEGVPAEVAIGEDEQSVQADSRAGRRGRRGRTDEAR